MRTNLAITCLLVLAAQNSPTPLFADEPKGNGASANQMLGTWKLVSARYGGKESTLPKVATTVKHVTPTHYAWATYDNDGKVSRMQGGPYTFDGEALESTPEYGIGPGFEPIKGKRQLFKCKFEGNRFYQNGTLSTSLTLEEVWERVEKK